MPFDGQTTVFYRLFKLGSSDIMLVAKRKCKEKGRGTNSSGRKRRWLLYALVNTTYHILLFKRRNKTNDKKTFNFFSTYVDRCSWYCFACDSVHVLCEHDSAFVLDCTRLDHEHFDFLKSESRFCKAVISYMQFIMVKC